MVSVRTCSEAKDALPLPRVGEPRRLSSGTIRRYVHCLSGRDVLIQLPTCFTPTGILHDFDEGARIEMNTTDEPGRKEIMQLEQLCRELAQSSSDASGKAISVPCSVGDTSAAVTASTGRFRDVRIFEASDMPADECEIRAGDTLTAIVSPEYVWIGAKRCGVHVRLVQLLLHTDRGKYRAFLFKGAHAPPPPPPLPAASSGGRPAPPPPPIRRQSGTIKSQRETAAPPSGGFRPSVMEIVTAKNLLKKTSR